MEISKLDRRSQYSIKVIREALFELLEQKTLEEITVVEICKNANVNRGTFYKYYRDVPDLYNKTEDALVEELHALLPDTSAEEYKPQFFFQDILHILTENREFIFIAKNKQFSERLARKLLIFFRPYIQKMTRACHPDYSDTENILLTEYILGGCTKVVTYWFNDNMQISIEQMETLLSGMIQQSLQFSQTRNK